jgi:hypothetical protein
MQNFIVLGVVPGTTIQLTFNFWLGVSIALLSLPLLRAMWRLRGALRELLVAIAIARAIDRYRVPA